MSERERHACRLMELARSKHHYRSCRAERDAGPRTRLKELARKRMRFGYRRLTAMLGGGMPANHKRVHRLYREEGLGIRFERDGRSAGTGGGQRGGNQAE
jgi:putative transposase